MYKLGDTRTRLSASATITELSGNLLPQAHYNISLFIIYNFIKFKVFKFDVFFSNNCLKEIQMK